MEDLMASNSMMEARYVSYRQLINMSVQYEIANLGYRYADHLLSGGTTKIGRRRLIEGEKGKKKKKRKKRKKKEERRGEEEIIPPCPRAVTARGSLARCRRPRAVAALARDFSSAQGERSRRHYKDAHR
ncbi:hypothetical protein GW17_00036816 [Ensete ventricosum]|nr:hypothetical protein GW17_00036816 [Ensete ventricosum]